MCSTIEMYDGRVYGHEVSEYGRENGRLDYRTLAKMVDDMVLCNGIIRKTWSIAEDWETVNGCDYDEEADSYEEVYQEYIISECGARVLMEYTNEIVYYSEELDIYVWCITHWGTGWDYVLTGVHLVEQTA